MLASYEKSLRAAFTVVFCVALGLQAYAQSGRSSISGTVLDPSGAVVANASVEIHNRSAVMTGRPPPIVRGISVSRTYRLIRIT